MLFPKTLLFFRLWPILAGNKIFLDQHILIKSIKGITIKRVKLDSTRYIYDG
jgi:hypothetical protein